MAAPRMSAAALAAAMAERTGQEFADAERLQRALTHASARGSAGTDYERLEFLGDRVLGLVVAEFVFATFPRATEGELSLRLNALVNAETLAEIAGEIGLADFIRAGRELRALSGAKRVNIRADAMEALIAAVYLEGGLDAARRFIRRFWGPRMTAHVEARRDPKTELQEWAHRVSGETPVYRTVGREGPDHDPLFTVAVRLGERELARGDGKSKREAEQAAATAILIREGVWSAPENTE